MFTTMETQKTSIPTFRHQPLRLAIAGLLSITTGATLLTIQTFVIDSRHIIGATAITIWVLASTQFLAGILLVNIALYRSKASFWKNLFHANSGALAANAFNYFLLDPNDLGVWAVIMWGWVVGVGSRLVIDKDIAVSKDGADIVLQDFD